MDTTISPTRTGAEQGSSFFAGAVNTVINGGTFVGITQVENDDHFKSLQRMVACAAFHSSSQRVDPPRCHENTRKAVLEEMIEWICPVKGEEKAAISWLHGAAGAGKSAIAQTLAELCISLGIPVASFFFSRSDSTRATLDPLIATLAYQLILLCPDTKDIICRAIKHDPLLFQQSLEAQFEALIGKPLRICQPEQPIFLIIDGVDECRGPQNQVHIINAMAKAASSMGSHILILFSSRPEMHLQAAFRVLAAKTALGFFPLDDNYRPDADIRLFLNDKFSEIRQTHPLSSFLNPNWPSQHHIEQLVEKASGQFIYAAVAIRFISSPYASPIQQLEIVRGIKPAGLPTPFAELDALYRYIMSCVLEKYYVMRLLAFMLFLKTTYIPAISYYLDIRPVDVYATLSSLASVITCRGKDVRFLHASLQDFLLDPKRSLEHYIDCAVWSTELCITFFENSELGLYKGCMSLNISILLRQACGTEELKGRISAFHPSQIPSAYPAFYVDYLKSIRLLDLRDDGDLYQHQLKTIVRHLQRVNPDQEIYLSRLEGYEEISLLLESEKSQEENQPANAITLWRRLCKVFELPPEELPSRDLSPNPLYYSVGRGDLYDEVFEINSIPL